MEIPIRKSDKRPTEGWVTAMVRRLRDASPAARQILRPLWSEANKRPQHFVLFNALRRAGRAALDEEPRMVSPELADVLLEVIERWPFIGERTSTDKKVCTLWFPADVFDDINRAAKEAGLTRTAWIVRTCEQHLPLRAGVS